LWRNLTNLVAVDPTVLLKLACLSVAGDHVGGGEEEGLLVGRGADRAHSGRVLRQSYYTITILGAKQDQSSQCRGLRAHHRKSVNKRRTLMWQLPIVAP
jgi:hypothetical protein